MSVPPCLPLYRVGRGLLPLAVLFCWCVRIGNCFFFVPPTQAGIQHHAVFAGRCPKGNHRLCNGVFEYRGRGRRNLRTRLRESIRGNRDKIERARNRLRDAVRAGDEELAGRLKAFILHLRKQDPQYATQDAMNDALSKGLFGAAAKLKLQLDEINQNPFRQGLLKGREEIEAGSLQQDQGSSSSNSDDIAEDMSWGFDQSFFQKEGQGDEDADYDDI